MFLPGSGDRIAIPSLTFHSIRSGFLGTVDKNDSTTMANLENVISNVPWNNTLWMVLY